MLLIAGILLWSGTHLFVSLGRDTRDALVARIGLGPYKGLFSLTLLAALAMIVLGWQAFGRESLYLPPTGLRHLAMLLMPFAVILFISGRAPTDIRRLIRHPQLTGVKLWAVAHLLANGEIRSLILFGGLLAWAVAEVVVINRRTGAWQKPPPAGALKTTVSALVGLALTAGLVFAHPWLSGVPLIRG